MVKFSVKRNGANGQHRVQFREDRAVHKSSNLESRELAEAVKARLEAAASKEERQEILSEVKAARANQEWLARMEQSRGRRLASQEIVLFTLCGRIVSYIR